jgi:Concanavalin A-like lectin/glucanases superfamily
MSRTFNGSNTYLASTSTPVTSSSAGFTISVWFYVAATNVQYDAVFIKDSGASNYSGIYLGDGTSGKVGAVAGDGTESIAWTANTYSANTWNHACGVFTSNSSRSSYLNGGTVATDTGSRAQNTYTLIDAGGFFDGSSIFGAVNGRLAELAIWSVTLNASEVGGLAKGASALRIRSGSLVAYYPLYGTMSPELNLRSGTTGYKLTLNNSPGQAAHAPVASLFGASPARIFAAGAAAAAIVDSDTTSIFCVRQGWRAA